MISRRIRMIAAGAIAAVGGVALLTASPSAAVGGVELLPKHSYVAAQPTSGQYIKDLAIDNENHLLEGHGDYTSNTGPIAIAYINLTPGTGYEEGVHAIAPTEEINTFRKFHGNVFAPWIDPTGCGTCNPVNGGMTNDVDIWHNEHTFQAGHVYDYTELGASRFLAGAIAYGGAGVWQSDSGGPWRLVREENSAGGATGWERFYFAFTLKGKVYVQAKHNGGTEAQPSGNMFPMYSYDSSRWRKVRASISSVFEGHQLEVFKDKAYFRTNVFDGAKVRASGVPISLPQDWYNAGDHLYALNTAGRLARTDGTTWEDLGTIALPGTERTFSIAVSGDTGYVGTSLGNVYKFSLGTL